MKNRKNHTLVFLTSLAFFSACTPINQSTEIFSDSLININIRTKYSIKGIVEFPKEKNEYSLRPSSSINFSSLLTPNSLFSIKALITDLAQSATVSLIYPNDHLTKPNITISTAVTDESGYFILNPNFSPEIGQVYIIEATKRIVRFGNDNIALRTFIKWDGSNWRSITAPGVFINDKTTALTIISELNSSLINPEQTIGKMPVINNLVTISDISGTSVTSLMIKEVKNLVNSILSINRDPIQYIKLVNGKFERVNPPIVNPPLPAEFNYTGSFIAGTLDIGDGTQATNAHLFFPQALAIDSLANLYMKDGYNSRIRKIEKSTGIITTYKDSVYSSDQGDIIFDINDNLYFADTYSGKVYKVDKLTGIKTIIAGGGNLNSDEIQATDTNLTYPTGLLLDNNSNLLISVSYPGKIRKVDLSTGIITTIAGGGISNPGDGNQATNAYLNSPKKIAFDTLGNLFIAENSRIRKVDRLSGTITTFAGGGNKSIENGLNATDCYIYNPGTLSIDNTGNLLFSHYDKILKIDNSTGLISTVAGGGFGSDGSQATNASLSFPNGIVLDKTGNMYISSINNIRKVDTNNIISTFAGSYNIGDYASSTNAYLRFPKNVVKDSSGNLYFSDFYNDKIRKIDSETGIISTIEYINYPVFTIDNNDNLYFVNGPFLNKKDLKTGITTNIVDIGFVKELTWDKSVNLYFSDGYKSVKKVNLTTGNITPVAGSGDSGYSGDEGQATTALLNFPAGIALDSIGNIFIADHSNHRIRKIDKASGIIATVVGNGDYASNGDGGLAVNSSIRYPESIAIDNNDNLYLVDSGKVRKVDKVSGIINTISGSNISNPDFALNPYFGVVDTVSVTDNGELFVTTSKRIYKLSRVVE